MGRIRFGFKRFARGGNRVDVLRAALVFVGPFPACGGREGQEGGDARSGDHCSKQYSEAVVLQVCTPPPVVQLVVDVETPVQPRMGLNIVPADEVVQP